MQETLKYIEDHPEEWDQGSWAVRTSYGTARCFAGWAVALHEQGNPDDLFKFIVPYDGDDEEHSGFLRDGRGIESSRFLRDGRDIERAAMDCLRIGEQEAYALFSSDNNLEDLRVIVAELCGGRTLW
jgi:hypothetical protein